MDDDLNRIIEDSKRQAAQIVSSTGGIRAALADGRPNSSTESTVAGTLEAFAEIMKRLPEPKN
jgi:hypothetical protein